MAPSSILIVEDEAVVALDLKMQLEDLGYRVVGLADDAEQAMRMALQHRPSLALMDIQLKGSVDGVEVAAELRRQMDLPVIFLTSFSDAQTVRRAAETAPYGYLTKPFQIKEVAAGVEVALCKAQMERAERGTERSLAYALQCVSDGVVLTNEGQQIRFMNPAAERLTGWNLPDAVGRSLDEVVSTMQGPRAPAEEVSTKDSVAMGNAMTLHRRDGTALHVDEWTGPIRDAQGRQTGGIVLLRSTDHRLEVLEAPAGGPRPEIAPLQAVALRAAIDEAIGLLRPSAQAHHIGLDCRVPEGVQLQADPLRLRQVLLNVGSNAIKYSRPQGLVCWALEPAMAGRVKFSVVDEGVGMTPEQLARLYQPYDRLGQEAAGAAGTGLGLVITRGLVERMGGSIEITREPRGGTRVELEFDAAGRE